MLRQTSNGRIEITGTYEINKEYFTNKYNNEVGIDIGLKKLITCSDGEIVDQNKQIIKYSDYIFKTNRNRNMLEYHLKKKYDNKDFRLGNHRKLKMYNKIKNMVQCDNRYKIKQFLKGRNNDLIVMEDLEISESKTFNKRINVLLRLLHIQGIKNDIQKYCKEYGINLILINSAYTSQQCSCCGYTDKNNRKTQETFSCLKCGFTINADFNASINIKERIHIKDINLNTPTYKVKEILELNYTACN
jgi:putative transposase